MIDVLSGVYTEIFKNHHKLAMAIVQSVGVGMIEWFKIRDGNYTE